MDGAPFLISLLLSTALGQGEPHVDEVRGFRVDVPDGWSSVEQEQASEGFVLYVLPPGSSGRVLVGIGVIELAAGQGVEALVGKSLAKIESDPAFSALERFETELLGASRPALRVDFARPGGVLRIEATFLVDGNRGFVLQRAAPPEEFERWSDELAGVMATFAPVAPSERGLEQQRLAALAQRCGSEVQWEASWDEAASRARELERPVLVVAWLYPGFSLPSTPRSTTFMDEDVVALVNSRFVPYWHHAGAEAAFVERYGLSGSAFGQALLVVSPEGQVLFESDRAGEPDAAYAFLRLTLDKQSGDRRPKAAASARGAGELGRARQLLERGELEAVLELLERADSAGSWLLRAQALRLLRRGDEALAALASAREAGPTGPEIERTLCTEEALVNLRLGRAEAARAASEALAASGAEADAGHAAEFLLGLLDLQAGAREKGVERLSGLVDEHPDSRWAWQAAALLQSGMLDLGLPLDLGWPDEDLLAEALVLATRASLPPSRARSARDQALAWMLAAQREDGSWISPTELASSARMGPSPFVDAISALAARALLAHAKDKDARRAAERALDFLVATVEARKRTPTPVLYMDYTPWSDAAILDACAAALEARLGDADALRKAGEAVLADLATRQQPHGGWGYYVSGDLAGTAAPPASMSFTTAAVVLALVHAEAAGLEVQDSLIRPAVEALVRMRGGEGRFAYALGLIGGEDVPPSMVAGAAGRGPVCELALLRAGESTEKRLEKSLEVFLEHAPSLAAERGKVLMHAGQETQGCHYILFDYAWAAEAARELSGQRSARTRLLEFVLDCRQEDGSFLDTPINGRAYGTAMALLALED